MTLIIITIAAYAASLAGSLAGVLRRSVAALVTSMLLAMAVTAFSFLWYPYLLRTTPQRVVLEQYPVVQDDQGRWYTGDDETRTVLYEDRSGLVRSATFTDEEALFTYRAQVEWESLQYVYPPSFMPRVTRVGCTWDNALVQLVEGSCREGREYVVHVPYVADE